MKKIVPKNIKYDLSNTVWVDVKSGLWLQLTNNVGLFARIYALEEIKDKIL